MAFERSVMMPDGIVRTWHEVTGITQLVGQSTWIEVASWETRDAREKGDPTARTSVLHGFEDGMTVAEAEGIAKDSVDFREYQSPTEALIDELIGRAGEPCDLFDPWEAGHDYCLNDRVSHGGAVYRCIQSHKSQADWTPDATPALWVRVRGGGSEPEEWVQPTGAHDAYAKGDRVRHSGKVWESTVDANVWEPGVYGWQEVA